MNRTDPTRSGTVALLALGGSAVATQIMLLREFLAVFQGNELVIGIVLAFWLILTGAGALLGRRPPAWTTHVGAVPSALLALGIIPILTVFLIRSLRNTVFTAGSMVPILPAFAAAGLVLAPFCLLSGYSFALCARMLTVRTGDHNPAASAYLWESLGSAVAGLVFSLILIPFLEAFQVLAILLALDALVSVALATGAGARPVALVGVACFVGAVGTLAFADLDLLTRQFLFPRQNIVSFKDTPYGNLTVTGHAGQFSVFENGVLLFSTDDVTSNEENVHYAMVQRAGPRDVLLIGGGIAGTTTEVLKYGVRRLDYAEMNPWILRIGREFTTALNDSRIHVIHDDGRRYVRTTSRRYDVVLVNLPDPETIQLNRFYTAEFFREVKRILHDGGVLSTSLLPGAEYQGPEARSAGSVLHATLREVFARVLVVPGQRNYFLASDTPLDIRIGSLVEARDIPTMYVNRYYLDDRILLQRSDEIMAGFEPASPVNRDLEPIGYFRHLDYWLSYFGSFPALWLVLVVGGMLLLVWRFSPVGMGIFIGGFVGVSLEILILLLVQIMSGSLYYMTGVVITAFMTGLAGGAWAARRFCTRAWMPAFAVLQIVVAAACVMLPPLFSSALNWNMSAGSVQAFLAALAFCIAALFGMEFAVGSSVRGGTAGSTASELYGLDLAGSALGALLVSVYAIPLFGVGGVSRLLGASSAAAAVVCLVARRGRS